MHIIKECILEYRLTYMGERLFGNSVIKSHIKALKEMIKCFIDLITPTKDIDIDFWKIPKKTKKAYHNWYTFKVEQIFNYLFCSRKRHNR